jgi:hypothetical protein
MSILSTIKSWFSKPVEEPKRNITKFRSEYFYEREETKIGRARRLLTYDRLFELYVTREHTQESIANMYNIDTKSLRTIFKDVGLQARKRGRPSKKCLKLRAKKRSDSGWKVYPLDK